MSEYLTEDEKVEAIREWWKENGKSVIAGVILGVAALFGWRGWVDYREDRLAAASEIYAQLRIKVQQGQVEEARGLAEQLREDYTRTPYAALGTLQIAAIDGASADRLDAAAEDLGWVLDKARQLELQELARVRLARVRVAQDRPEDALALLQVELPAAYTGLVEELRGDAYRAQGRLQEAREAYDRAILLAGGAAEYLRMKRDDLGVPAAPVEPAS